MRMLMRVSDHENDEILRMRVIIGVPPEHFISWQGGNCDENIIQSESW